MITGRIVYFEEIQRGKVPADHPADSLRAYWHANVLEHGIPDRNSFNPEGLRPWLGCISIYKFLEEQGDFINALEGTLITKMTGQDWTGKLASDVDIAFRSTFRKELSDVGISKQPLMNTVQIFQKRYKTATRLLLPIAEKDGREANQIFLALFRNFPKNPGHRATGRVLGSASSSQPFRPDRRVRLVPPSVYRQSGKAVCGQ
tara:strand:+ start:1360 stop:1968 length:609 start_codon:yes stop_codon:yes gene_type:complete